MVYRLFISKCLKIFNFNKVIIFTALIIIASLTSCVTGNYLKYIFTGRISVQEAIDKKSEIDKSENPAQKLLLTKKLMMKRIKIENIMVKDIISSSNIDYSFCVVVTTATNKGPIDCYIYANDLYQQEDIKTISQLIKNKSLIDIDGDFKRFFTLLDETYTKIEIINAGINIVEK
jgi:hypothetical protein